MNIVQKTDEQLRLELKQIYSNFERGYSQDGKWVHGTIQKVRARLCEEAKISLNTMYAFERAEHNLGYKHLSRLCDWISLNK